MARKEIHGTMVTTAKPSSSSEDLVEFVLLEKESKSLRRVECNSTLLKALDGILTLGSELMITGSLGDISITDVTNIAIRII